MGMKSHFGVIEEMKCVEGIERDSYRVSVDVRA